MILSVQGISKAYGEDTVLSDVSFSVDEGRRVAVIGANGAGKTTLLKIISGGLSPDSGSVYVPKGASVTYLAQNAGFASRLSVYDEMRTAFTGVIAAEQKLRELETRMGTASGDEYGRLLADYNETLHFFEQNSGYEYESLARGVIAGLGLDGARKISELSGGQKTRVALAKALLRKPDLLLLDEPANHLDISALSWLEGYLKGYQKTLLFISHDRYFIDNVATRVIEIENSQAISYNGAYSFFIARKTADFEAAEKRHKDEARELAAQMESARLLKSFNRQKSVRRAESIERRIAKTEVSEKPREMEKISFSLAADKTSGREVLSVSEISKSFGGVTVLGGVSFDIRKDERVALLGANGVGKTTLLKIITGELTPDGGETRLGANVKIGLYEQERQNLDPSKTVIEHIHEKYPKLTDGEIRNTLAAFLFKGDDVFKPISALSGGEKGRVCLTEIMLSGANFLILDEPTNDLDMFSREILENALKRYAGTILCVSHDRYFINKVAGRVLELTESGINGYPGDYDYYLRKKAEDAAAPETVNEGMPSWASAKRAKAGQRGTAETQKASGTAQSDWQDTDAPGLTTAKSDWLKRKAEASEARKRAAAVERIERQIEETEADISRLNALLCSPDVFSDHIKAKEAHDLRQAAETELHRLYEQWEKANGEK